MRMSIIAQIQGGLGNQLFQYAAARSIAHQLGEELILDDQWYGLNEEGVTPRSLLLSKLAIHGLIQTYPHVVKPPKRWKRVLQNLMAQSPLAIKERRAYVFQDGLENARLHAQQDLYLIGYWQSFRYFESMRDLLAAEIKPLKPIEPHYQKYQDLISATSDAAMVHIRRGDYVHLPSAAQVHGALDLAYYEKSMKQLLQEKPNAHFFIFSDDIAWAKKHLPFQERLTFIENLPNEDAVIQELELMRSCRHHIIANSSLSWWGAWLGDSPEQIVYRPMHWTADHSLPLGDLLPAKWRQP